tara:strand:+ start:1075 stop:1203 length:129 start_codon:yes stop_codon:yes gene_type:complete
MSEASSYLEEAKIWRKMGFEEIACFLEDMADWVINETIENVL